MYIVLLICTRYVNKSCQKLLYFNFMIVNQNLKNYLYYYNKWLYAFINKTCFIKNWLILFTDTLAANNYKFSKLICAIILRIKNLLYIYIFSYIFTLSYIFINMYRIIEILYNSLLAIYKFYRKPVAYNISINRKSWQANNY